MTSLRARLFVALAGAMLVTGSIAGALAFRWAFDEAIELQDAVLLQVGSLAVRTHGPIELPPEGGVDAEAKVTIEELSKAPSDGTSANALPPLPDDLRDGLQTLSRGGERWRVLVRRRNDGSRVAISQPTASRDEIAHDSAVRTIVPLFVLLPLLMLLTGVIIRVSLRSVATAARHLDAKEADQLDHLPLDGMPDELVPFVASINRLLERIGIVFEQQNRFIAAAAHELRTPITALGLQAENLGQRGLDDEGTDRLDTLKSGIRRIAHLLEQLLAASKYEARPTTPAPPTAFDPLVKNVVADHLPAAHARGIDLGFERIDAVSVRADATSLTVLVRNLIENALRHTPDGGRIDIHLAQDAHVVRLRIEDTGPGIPATEIERVFEPFFRGERARGDGSGLGLSIVHSIVQRASGSITVENLDGKLRSGLRVEVTFPA